MRTTSLVPDPAVVTLEEIVADDAGVTLVLRASPDRLLPRVRPPRDARA